MNKITKYTTIHIYSILCAMLSALLILYPTTSIGFLSDDFLDLDHSFAADTFVKTEAGGFRPLIVGVWALDSHLWGGGRTWPVGWHLTNLLIHCVNIVLIALLLDRLSLTREAVFWGSLFFAVSWAVVPAAGRISGRTTMLATAPLILSLILHSEWLKRRSIGYIVLSGVSFLISLLFKETMLLCAPLFGLFAIAGTSCGGRSKWRLFLVSTLAYLIPTLLYVGWRLYWTGPFQSYQDSSHSIAVIVRNLTDLAVMPFSPWLDAIPSRLVLAASLLALFIVPSRKVTKTLLSALLILPLAAVLSLPPRPDFAYAALPFAAVLVSAVARRSGNTAGRLCLGLFILGCSLAARDEVSRLVQAGSYTREAIHHLDDLAGSVEPGAVVFVSGIRFEEAGYGTLWPNAFDAALNTIGSRNGDRIFTPSVFWEVAWPLLEQGDTISCVFARLSPAGWSTRELSLCGETFPSGMPALEVALEGSCVVETTPEMRRYSTLSVPGGSQSTVAVSDAFDPCSLVVLNAFTMNGDTALFDLSSHEAWLLGSRTVAIRSDTPLRNVLFTTNKLWLDELMVRNALKTAELSR